MRSNQWIIIINKNAAFALIQLLACLMFSFWKLSNRSACIFILLSTPKNANHTHDHKGLHQLTDAVYLYALFNNLLQANTTPPNFSDRRYWYPVGSDGPTAHVAGQTSECIRWTNPITPILLRLPLLCPAPEGPGSLIPLGYILSRLTLFGLSPSLFVLSRLVSCISSCLRLWPSRWSRYQGALQSVQVTQLQCFCHQPPQQSCWSTGSPRGLERDPSVFRPTLRSSFPWLPECQDCRRLQDLQVPSSGPFVAREAIFLLGCQSVVTPVPGS